MENLKFPSFELKVESRTIVEENDKCREFWAPYVHGKYIGDGKGYEWVVGGSGGVAVTNINWHPTQPDGLHGQPCTVYNNEGVFYDRGCAQANHCVKCLVEQNKIFYFRGISEQPAKRWRKMDKMYVIDADAT